MPRDAKYNTNHNPNHNPKNKNNPIPKPEDGVAVENRRKRGFQWKNLWKAVLTVTIL